VGFESHLVRTKPIPIMELEKLFSRLERATSRLFYPVLSQWCCTPLGSSGTLPAKEPCLRGSRTSVSTLPLLSSGSTKLLNNFTRARKHRIHSSSPSLGRARTSNGKAVSRKTKHARHRIMPRFGLTRARVRRNHGRLRSNGFIEGAPEHRACRRDSECAPPIKH